MAVFALCEVTLTVTPLLSGHCWTFPFHGAIVKWSHRNYKPNEVYYCSLGNIRLRQFGRRNYSLCYIFVGKLEPRKYLTLEFLFELNNFYSCNITYITHHTVISKAYRLTITGVKCDESNIILMHLYLLWPICELWHLKQQVLWCHWRVAPRGELTSVTWGGVTWGNCFSFFSQQVFLSE